MTTEDRTEYTVSKADQQKIIAIFGDEIQELPLSGEQLLGRPVSGFTPDLPIPVLSVSRKHGIFRTSEAGCQYCDLNGTNGTWLNGQPLLPGTAKMLRDGDALRIHGRQARGYDLDVLMIYTVGGRTDAPWRTMPLTNDIVELGVGSCDTIRLPDGEASPHHASFLRRDGQWAVVNSSGSADIFINNWPVGSLAYLSPMDVVRIAGHFFVFLGGALVYQPEPEAADASQHPAAEDETTDDGSALLISIKEKNVWHQMKKLTLLRDIELKISAGDMVLVLGGSGAGKTTFINAVMGYEPADGVIHYKGADIYTNYERMKYEIGYVPQQDLLRMNDSVFDTLLNAAKMKLPANLTAEELEQRVKETLYTLGLESERNALVRSLSGGQRKRLSIAVQYIGGPSLFFLDEPDSGLAMPNALSLMQNLRAIADEGKIVVVISHYPNKFMHLLDKVIVLAKDWSGVGRLAFYGSPSDACAFFGTDGIEEIVSRINPKGEGGEGLADEFIERWEKRTKREL